MYVSILLTLTVLNIICNLMRDNAIYTLPFLELGNRVDEGEAVLLPF